MYEHIELLRTTHAYEELRRDCACGRIKHAYVLVSEDFDALDTLAAMFICAAETGETNGARADRMLKRLRDGGYLDVCRFPSPEKKGKMDVEEVSRIIESAYLQPTELSAKYYIIGADEPLGMPVQNKLLKTLEEPPESARFLLYSRGNDLLPTVTSRSSLVALAPFETDTVARELMRGGVEESAATFAAAVSRGNLGAADRIVADPAYRQAYESAILYLSTVKRSPQILPVASAVIALKDKIPAFIDYLELLLRDVAVYETVGAAKIVLAPAVSEIRALTAEYDTRTVLAVLPLLRHARERLRLYGNPAGVIDELLFGILEVKAKCRKS